MSNSVEILVSTLEPLAGRVVLVTGAGSGIGLATTRLLVQADAHVHAVGSRPQVIAERLATEIDSGSATAHGVDVTDADAVERLFGTVGTDRPLDAVVLCAGTNIPARRLSELSEAGWQTVLSTNLNGVFSCLRAALPQLRETRGHAVVIASVSALWPDQSGAAYQASKAGVLALVRAASYEEHERGVRFTTVMPGMVLTELIDKRPELPSEQMRAQMLLPEDVAATILCALRLPPHACLSELTIVPTALQAVGKT
jgi:NAD(P)-dependent dehydrogenase (short-subunit alcohol dehydrogenase family)